MAGKKGSRWKHRGIGRAARELGVHQSHLWRVLLPDGARGKRHSRRLLARYEEWIRTSGGGQAAERGEA
jgi:hypothetical protein